MGEAQQQKNYYLIGTPLSKIDCANNPTLRQLLQNMLFQHYVNKKTIRESVHSVIQSCVPLWKRFEIVTKRNDKLVEKLEDEYKRWQNVAKNHASKTQTQVDIRQKFIERLDKEFEARKFKPTIEPENQTEPEMFTLDLEQIQDDELQMPELVQMPSVEYEPQNEPSTSREAVGRKRQRQKSIDAAAKLKLHAEKRNRNDASGITRVYFFLLFFFTFSTTYLNFLDESSLSASQLGQSSDEYASSNEKYTAKPKIRFIDTHLLTTLDALALTDRQAVRLISSVAEALKFNLEDLVLSRSSIRRARMKNRKSIADRVKHDFEVSNSYEKFKFRKIDLNVVQNFRKVSNICVKTAKKAKKIDENIDQFSCILNVFVIIKWKIIQNFR